MARIAWRTTEVGALAIPSEIDRHVEVLGPELYPARGLVGGGIGPHLLEEGSAETEPVGQGASRVRWHVERCGRVGASRRHVHLGRCTESNIGEGGCLAQVGETVAATAVEQ